MGSTHVVEQFLFSIFSSILTFHFDLVLGSFFIFGVLLDYFCGRSRVKKVLLGSTYIVEQLLFSIVSSILTFDLDLIFGSFLTF